ncbi:hypothetical protein DM02DRAFT_531270 [Periconia macrospinosa]|uniref:J domain-containing protein n=1 Tax=Periconia macrospinosa TaxID=97972 RepID=A0A2V1DJW3_9PLEO|nr:hypothetical protein DM02DRAFT_531270 [Periconia macrospinosa]
MTSPSLAETYVGIFSAGELIDHYEILGLDMWATSEEVKNKYRQLRADYFENAPEKYRALQAAYLVLVDREARLKYDTLYRQRFGMPPPPSSKTPAPVARKDSMSVVESQQNDDPNWALKHFNPVYNPTIGTRTYWSYIPIAIDESGTFLSIPKYTGEMAKYARP